MEIARITFEGMKAIEIKTAKMRLVAVTECGPRIAFLGQPDGQNLLLWKPGKYTRGDWDLRGGHRVWVARPEADEAEETYATDNGPCDVEIQPNGVRIIGQEHPFLRIRRGIEIKVQSDSRIDVDNILINSSDMLFSGAIWALTCTIPTAGTRYAVAVGDDSSWDAFTMVNFKQWAGHGRGGFADSQVTVTDDLVILEPKGIENKRMLQSHKGLFAMSDPVNDVTFLKKTGYEPGAPYPLNTNIAFYVGPDNFMVEMETMGPSKPLKPGDELHHIETWILHGKALTFDNAAVLTGMLGG